MSPVVHSSDQRQRKKESGTFCLHGAYTDLFNDSTGYGPILEQGDTALSIATIFTQTTQPDGHTVGWLRARILTSHASTEFILREGREQFLNTEAMNFVNYTFEGDYACILTPQLCATHLMAENHVATLNISGAYPGHKQQML